jgi:hypothetical protein
MDTWHSLPLRAEAADPVRRWADLEGKSPTMRDELYRQHASRKSRTFQELPQALMAIELIAALLNGFWHARH